MDDWESVASAKFGISVVVVVIEGAVVIAKRPWGVGWLTEVSYAFGLNKMWHSENNGEINNCFWMF